MNSNSSNKQLKADPKPEAISSLVLGIITILLAIILAAAFYFDVGGYISVWEGIIVFVAGLSFFWGWLLAMTGISLGIMGLKSTKKELAITGIILSLMTIIFYLMALMTDISEYISVHFYY